MQVRLIVFFICLYVIKSTVIKDLSLESQQPFALQKNDNTDGNEDTFSINGYQVKEKVGSLSSSSSCSSIKVAVTISRVTRGWSYEENFKIYQGTTIYGKLVYTQPNIVNNRSYTWTVCLSTGSHVIQFLDNAGNGWTVGSTLSLTMGLSTIGPYRLGSGSSGTFSFTVPSIPSSRVLSSVHYPVTYFRIQEGIYFSVSPLNDVNGINYSISSGSLESGLYLDSSTGTISGIPLHAITYRSVTIKAYTGVTTYVNHYLSFSVFHNPSICLSNMTLVTINRVTKGSSIEESFKIYEGMNVSGNAFYVQPYIMDYRSYTWTVCLNTGTHAFYMTDSSNVWSSGSSVSLTVGSKTMPFSMSQNRLHWFFITSSSIYLLGDVTYPVNSFIIPKGVSFSISPKSSPNDVYYSITSGSLPTGLSLSSSGIISGIPSVVTSLNVTIRIHANTEYCLNRTITFTVFENPSVCPSNMTLVTINRVTKGASIEESFKIYEGTNTTDPLVYTQPYVLDYRSYTWTACFSSYEHTLEFIDSGGNGWSSGSYVSFSIGSSTLGTYHLNSGSSSTESFTLPLTAPSGFAYPSSSFAIAQNQTFTAAPEVVGILLTFSIHSGTFPEGLTLNSTTGVISGTPLLTVLNQAVSIKVSNPFGQQIITIAFTVMVPPLSLSYSSQSIPKLQQASIQPVYSGGPCSFSVSTGSLPSGLSLDTSTGIISGIPTATSSQQTVTIKAQNAVGQITFSFTITPLRIPSDFAYSPSYYILPVNKWINVMPSSIVGDALTFVVANGTLPSQITLNSLTGGLNGYVTLAYPFTTITIKASNCFGFTTTEISFQFTVPPSNLKFPLSEYFIPVGEPFSTSLSCQGDPAVFSLSNGILPEGLTFDPLTGVIEGTPTEYTLSTVTITAANDGGTASVVLSISVLNIPSVKYGEGVLWAIRDIPFSAFPTYKGELVSFKLNGTLPSGYDVNSKTGEISGQCSSAGITSFEIEIVNEVGSSTTTVIIVVSIFSVETWIGAIASVVVLSGVAILALVPSKPCGKSHKKELPIVKKPKLNKSVVVEKHIPSGYEVDKKPVSVPSFQSV